ncbi:MAG: glycosyltransferase, partial [Patescibacteria group bacterium]
RDYFATSILQYIRQCNIEDRIIIVDNATTADLVFFYKHAQALIHPSLSEGFGLPIIEATYFNLPIIASSIPVFQELLKGRYTSFNPRDTADIQNKITNFISHPLKADYGSILTQYSFKTMAQNTISLYQEALESKEKI